MASSSRRCVEIHRQGIISGCLEQQTWFDESQQAGAEMKDRVAGRARARKDGYPLEQYFYRSPEVYERDIERIFMREWLYVAHVSEIPNPGDYVLFEVANESVIVARDGNGQINALVNVCRHRGSRICLSNQGNCQAFVCPYHGWAYGLDGALRSTRYMPESFDKGAHGLHHVHSWVLQGLIFINFAETPVSPSIVERNLDAALKPQGLAHAKVAHKALYRIDANWKLMVENYLECYHCAPAHPEYSRGHSRKAPPERVAELSRAMLERAQQAGLSTVSVFHWGSPAAGDAFQHYFERYPLYPDYLTGSEDGKPVAPLMGDITAYDGGATDISIGPVTYFLAYSDHVVGYRFTPRDVQKTDCEIVWYVDEHAEEGKDYDLERLTWLWRITTEADKRIVDCNQKGVNSRYYQPGPFSSMEYYADEYVDWYLKQIA